MMRGPKVVGIEFVDFDGNSWEGVAMASVGCASILPHTITRFP
jgi:hypothetical protein